MKSDRLELLDLYFVGVASFLSLADTFFVDLSRSNDQIFELKEDADAQMLDHVEYAFLENAVRVLKSEA